MRSVAALLVAAVLAAAPSSPPAPAGRLPPAPLVVESAPEAPGGVLRIAPAVVHVRAAPGESVQPELLIVNGAESPLDLLLAVASVEPAPDGAPTPAEPTGETASAVPSAATWFALPASRLHLDPGEEARLRPTISVPALAEPGGYVAALRAAPRDGSGVTSPSNPQVAAFILVEVPSSSSATTSRMAATTVLARSGLAGAEARLRFDAEQSEVVAGRLTVRAWWGASLLDVAIPPTVVLLAVPRTQRVSFGAPVLPGPYHLVASLETATGETLTARATTWLWNPLATLLILLVVLLVSAAVVARRPSEPRRNLGQSEHRGTAAGRGGPRTTPSHREER